MLCIFNSCHKSSKKNTTINNSKPFCLLICSTVTNICWRKINSPIITPRNIFTTVYKSSYTNRYTPYGTIIPFLLWQFHLDAKKQHLKNLTYQNRRNKLVDKHYLNTPNSQVNTIVNNIHICICTAICSIHIWYHSEVEDFFSCDVKSLKKKKINSISTVKTYILEKQLQNIK